MGSDTSITPYETGRKNLVGELRNEVVPQYFEKYTVTNSHQFKQSRFSAGQVVLLLWAIDVLHVVSVVRSFDPLLCCLSGCII